MLNNERKCISSGCSFFSIFDVIKGQKKENYGEENIFLSCNNEQ